MTTSAKCAIATIIFFSGILHAMAHEFWIEPKSYFIAQHQNIVAELKTGEMLKGESQAFLPNMMEAFDIYLGDASQPVMSRFGDTPAMNQAVLGKGLHTIRYESDIHKTTYDDGQKFADFVEREGLPHILQRHRERGLPDSGFTEIYWRFAKTLVAVDTTRGEDQNTGMRFELVAVNNPLAAPKSLEVLLLYDGQPHGNAQISIYYRESANTAVERSVTYTDSSGRAFLDLNKPGEYLLNAVHMLELDPSRNRIVKDAVWESLWASLTFATH